MNISHLRHDDASICCLLCRREFEVPRSVLKDADRLVDFKESLAARHSCGAKTRVVVKEAMPFAGDPEFDLNAYFEGTVRRMISA